MGGHCSRRLGRARLEWALAEVRGSWGSARVMGAPVSSLAFEAPHPSSTGPNLQAGVSSRPGARLGVCVVLSHVFRRPLPACKQARGWASATAAVERSPYAGTGGDLTASRGPRLRV